MTFAVPGGDVIRDATVLIGIDPQVNHQVIFVVTSQGATVINVALSLSAPHRYSQMVLDADKLQEFIDTMMMTMPSPFLKALEDEWRRLCLEQEPS